MITRPEVKLFALFFLFGLCNWFLLEGVSGWIDNHLPGINTFWIGLAGLLILLFLFRFGRKLLPFI